jgi:hypothetical protein
MRALPLVALLLTQEPAIDLERDRLAMYDGSHLALITLIAQYEDGTPARGYIACEGSWYKHADRDEDTAVGIGLPFKTDARGAIVMNPLLSDEWIECFASKDGYYGRVRVEFSDQRPAQVVRLVLRKDT